MFEISYACNILETETKLQSLTDFLLFSVWLKYFIMNDQTYFALIEPLLPLEQHLLSGVAIWKYYKLETLILLYHLFEDLPMIKESTSIFLNSLCMNPKLEWNLPNSLDDLRSYQF